MVPVARARRQRRAKWARWLSVITLVLMSGAGGALAPGALANGAPTPTTDPGLLLPTRAEPSMAHPLRVRMEGLFEALVSGNVARANAVFFPRSAYLRMKSGLLADPTSDYAHRLLALFDLDVAAYHRQLTGGAASTLLRVSVNDAYATWIAPRQCENLIGYWHLPGVRFVFRRGPRVWSVAVASLISWRGVWYVVHLGPNPRSRNVGTLDDFRSGPGSPGPAGGC